MLHVRLLGPEDSIVELTGLINRAYAPLGRLGMNFTGVDQTPEETLKRVLPGICLLACDGPDIVGTISLRGPRAWSQCEYLTRPGVAIMTQLAVDPARQGEGIGGMLVEQVESLAREDGFAELVADTAESATWLLSWYERLGFQRIGEVSWVGKTYRSVLIGKRLAS